MKYPKKIVEIWKHRIELEKLDDISNPPFESKALTKTMKSMKLREMDPKQSKSIFKYRIKLPQNLARENVENFVETQRNR